MNNSPPGHSPSGLHQRRSLFHLAPLYPPIIIGTKARFWRHFIITLKCSMCHADTDIMSDAVCLIILQVASSSNMECYKGVGLPLQKWINHLQSRMISKRMPFHGVGGIYNMYNHAFSRRKPIHVHGNNITHHFRSFRLLLMAAS